MSKCINAAVILCFLAVGMAGKPNKTATEKQTSPNPEATAPLTVNNQNETTCHTNKSDNNPPRWYAPLERPDWWLVIVAALTGYLIWRQAREMARATEVMKEQTDATRKAADAALLNAQAVINAERPWFVVTIEHSIGYPGFYNIKITNKGRTPGVLEDVFVERHFIENPKDLPYPPVYSSGCVGPNDNLFVTGDDFTVLPHFNPRSELDEWKQSPTHGPCDFRIAYGKLTYRDTLTPDKSRDVVHETRWCYYWHQAETRWVRCGSKEYTGHHDYQRNKA